MSNAPLQTAPKRDTPLLALRPREAAKALGVSERTLWTWTDAGQVPFVRIGKSILYPVDSLRRWLDEQAAKSQTAPDALPQANGGAE